MARPGTWVIVALLAVNLLVVPAAGGPRTPDARSAIPPFAPAPFHPGGPAPAAAHNFYLQEGATLIEEDGNPGASFAAINETFTLVTSVYGIAYEINGLSDTGDWYQALAFYNWPGCPAGFGFGYEVWDAGGFSYAGPACNIPIPLTAGDIVQVGLSLGCSGGPGAEACLWFNDLTTGQRGFVTGPQPDPGATYFVNLNTPGNAYGYFTGPMTEMLDQSSTSCGPYPYMPTVSYVIEGDGHTVSTYIPWADEFDYAGTAPTLCYASEGTLTDVIASPVSQYFEATGGNPLGPHWVAGQAWSLVSQVPGQWRFQTDVVPMAVTLALSRPSADLGQSLTVAGLTNGGLPPYQCQWFVDGVEQSSTSCTPWTLAPTAVGIHTISVYLVDRLSDYVAGTVTLPVYSAPVVAAPELSRPTLDLGQSVNLTAVVNGGSGGYSFSWSGMPPGCASSLDSFKCVPNAIGTFHVVSTVTDSNGVSVSSAPVTLGVSPAPTVTLSATPAPALLGGTVSFRTAVSGGLSPFVFSWSGLPPGCIGSPESPNVSCAPTSLGSFSVAVRLLDQNGVNATASLRLEVDRGFLGMPEAIGITLVVGVPLAIVLLAIVAVIAVRRRRRRRPPQARPNPQVTPQPSTPPSPPSPPPESPPEVRPPETGP